MHKLLAAVILLAVSIAHADTIYVDDDAPPGGDGTSWATAYRFLQDALSVAKGGTEIRVGQGTYKPDRSRSNPGLGYSDCCSAHQGGGCDDVDCAALVCAIQSSCCNADWVDACAELAEMVCTELRGPDQFAAFQPISGVAIYGGFAGIGAIDPDARDIQLYETILSGDLLGNDGPGFLNYADNSVHVVVGGGTDSTARLDGVTITGGNADDNDDPLTTFGGGIFNSGGDLTIANCTIVGNFAWFGGGIYNMGGADATIVDSTFVGNQAHLGVTGFGGGIYNEFSSPTITGTTFTDNGASRGGGIYNNWSDPVLTDCTLIDNAASRGGGIYNSLSNPILTSCSILNTLSFYGSGIYNDMSGPTITGCTFSGNVSEVDGPAIYNLSSNPLIMACLFTGNTAESWGGAIFEFASLSTVIGCVFDGNNAQGNGGAIFIWAGAPSYADCTISNSLAGSWAGAVLSMEGANPTFTNCTFTGNITSSFGGAVMLRGGSGTFSECSFIGNAGYAGGGIISGFLDDTNITVADCTFEMNTAAAEGGGLYNFGGTSSITNTVFRVNQADEGGGLYLDQDTTNTLINCLFDRNIANSTGGAILAGGVLDAVNNTVIANTATNDGGAMRVEPAGATITWSNGVVWANTPDAFSGVDVPTVTYSDVQGGFPGTGNIDADPKFVDSDNGNYRLSPGSPCIDAGDNTAVPVAITTDLDGNPRFVDDPHTVDIGNGDPPVVDMGAYELCPWDCAGDNDGDVGINDFLALLAQWGGPGACDFDGGNVGIDDFLELLANWGPCP